MVPTYHTYQWTEASRQDARRYQKGDVLAFHQDSAGFKKGEYVRYEQRQGFKIVVQDGTGKRLAFDPATVGGFDVGLIRSLPVAVGERLLIRANLKEQRLFNGNIVEVAQVAEDGTIILKDERTIPPDFRQFSHGYATTSHAAQGNGGLQTVSLRPRYEIRVTRS